MFLRSVLCADFLCDTPLCIRFLKPAQCCRCPAQRSLFNFQYLVLFSRKLLLPLNALFSFGFLRRHVQTTCQLQATFIIHARIKMCFCKFLPAFLTFKMFGLLSYHERGDQYNHLLILKNHFDATAPPCIGPLYVYPPFKSLQVFRDSFPPLFQIIYLSRFVYVLSDQTCLFLVPTWLIHF